MYEVEHLTAKEQKISLGIYWPYFTRTQTSLQMNDDASI